MIINEKYIMDIDDEDDVDNSSNGAFKTNETYSNQFIIKVNIDTTHSMSMSEVEYGKFLSDTIDDLIDYYENVLDDLSWFSDNRSDFLIFIGESYFTDKYVTIGSHKVYYHESIKRQIYSIRHIPYIKIKFNTDCLITRAKDLDRFLEIMFAMRRFDVKKQFVEVVEVNCEKWSEILVDYFVINRKQYLKAEWSSNRFDRLCVIYSSMTRCLGRPGLYGAYIKSKGMSDYTVFLNSVDERHVNIETQRTHIPYNGNKYFNIMGFCRCGSGKDREEYCIGRFGDKYLLLESFYETNSEPSPLSEKDYQDLCEKAYEYYSSDNKLYDMLIETKGKYGYIYFIFRDTFVYKDMEFVVYLYHDNFNEADRVGTNKECLLMLVNDKFDLDHAIRAIDNDYLTEEEFAQAVEEAKKELNK